jgi:HK97 family phage portal protein
LGDLEGTRLTLSSPILPEPQPLSPKYANGARPGGILKLKGRLSQQSLERLTADFAGKWGGLAGSGRTLILEDDANYEGLTFSSTDLQHLELRRFQVSEIARAFRIPPHMLADLERTTHSNAEEMGSQFLQLSLLPHIVNWEQAMRRSLLSPEERRRYTIEFLSDGLARAALESLRDPALRRLALGEGGHG